jgi:hypothetical protein
MLMLVEGVAKKVAVAGHRERAAVKSAAVTGNGRRLRRRSLPLFTRKADGGGDGGRYVHKQCPEAEGLNRNTEHGTRAHATHTAVVVCYFAVAFTGVILCYRTTLYNITINRTTCVDMRMHFLLLS